MNGICRKFQQRDFVIYIVKRPEVIPQIQIVHRQLLVYVSLNWEIRYITFFHIIHRLFSLKDAGFNFIVRNLP